MAKQPSHPVRLIDIARAAGVSKVTVAKALHDAGGNTRISKATAERIRQIAAELNYHPNLAARQLQGQRSYLIGGIIDSHAPASVSKQIATLEQSCAEKGYRFIVGYAHDNLDRFTDYAQDFLGRNVDGVICLSHTYEQFGEEVEKLFLNFRHCVFIEAPLKQSRIPYVSPDYEAGGYLAARHLLSLGRRRVGIIEDGSNGPSVQDEFKGYRKALAEAGVPFDPSLTWRTAENLPVTGEAMERSVAELLPAHPDAIIVPNDGKAIWLMRSLMTRGIKVPDDVAVVSTDRWEIGQAWVPAITAVDLRFDEVVRQAIAILFEDIENPESPKPEPRSVIVPAKLIVAQSCGAELRT